MTVKKGGLVTSVRKTTLGLEKGGEIRNMRKRGFVVLRERKSETEREKFLCLDSRDILKKKTKPQENKTKMIGRER